MTDDATEAYPRELGLQRYVRHLLFVKPDVLLVCNEVIMDQSRSLKLKLE